MRIIHGYINMSVFSRTPSRWISVSKHTTKKNHTTKATSSTTGFHLTLNIMNGVLTVLIYWRRKHTMGEIAQLSSMGNVVRLSLSFRQTRRKRKILKTMCYKLSLINTYSCNWESWWNWFYKVVYVYTETEPVLSIQIPVKF